MKIITQTTTLDQSDMKYLLDKPEEGFNPERNAANIKKAIDSGMRIEMDLRKAQQKDMEYRIDILSSYAMHQANTNSSKRLEQYVGKQEMAKIYGEKILEKIRIMESVQKLNKANGNTIMGGKFFLT